MAIREVLRMGNPLLRQIAEPVENPLAADIQQLITDLRETMQARSGAGLCAPQIGISKRVLIYGNGAPNPRYPDAGIIQETVLINPILTAICTGQQTESEMQTGWEGCLSVPGLRGEVQRWRRLRLQACNANGQEIDRILEGFEARVVQHECDHLDGILFPDRLISPTRIGYIEELVLSGQIPAVPA
ncbi:peptide deformylase [Cyanobium sp. WAJ14-Wanaka]|uniref:peptide deformylase n=1 Tax=Cyanobium sp. WAJ14-Wanaka TaxID=2823725 RepID=UPI0020CD1C9C|nr:peptide deformylase [Cyanobium sp. WAJ14-Wanaka]MCP9774845.1 peptide deformylase [Cyanobium sp. WAJ14-Wanaka]